MTSLSCEDHVVYSHSALSVRIKYSDVNSWQIAFLGGELQVPGLDRGCQFHPSTYQVLYRRDRSQIAGRGAKEAGVIAPGAVPSRYRDPIDWST